MANNNKYLGEVFDFSEIGLRITTTVLDDTNYLPHVRIIYNGQVLQESTDPLVLRVHIALSDTFVYRTNNGNVIVADVEQDIGFRYDEKVFAKAIALAVYATKLHKTENYDFDKSFDKISLTPSNINERIEHWIKD